MVETHSENQGVCYEFRLERVFGSFLCEVFEFLAISFFLLVKLAAKIFHNMKSK